MLGLIIHNVDTQGRAIEIVVRQDTLKYTGLSKLFLGLRAWSLVLGY